MADMLAEEDDDEGFGDFKFADVVPSPAPRHSSFQSDDYWSGFVGLNGTGIAPSRSSPSIASNYEEKIGFYMDHTVTQPPLAVPADPVKPKWAKPSGAIPLSIFGEDEKEEQVANGENGSFQHTNEDLMKKDSISKRSVGLDDLIANLLSQNRKIASAYASNANLATNAENIQKKDSEIGSEEGLNPDSGLNGWDSKAPEEKELDDEDDWEFMAADGKAKEEQHKSGTATDLNFNISTASWNYLSTDRVEYTSCFNGLNSDNNRFDLDLLGKEKDSEVDDFDWEFKGSELQTHPKDGNAEVNGSTKDQLVNAEVYSAVENAVHEHNHLYVASDGVFQNLSAFDFAFNLNPKAGSQGSVFSDSNSTRNMNAVKYDSNSNSTNENSWKLKDAASEIGPSSKDDPKDANGILLKPAQDVASVNPWAFQDAFSDNDSKHKGNKGHQNTEKQSLPLDLFGEAQLEDKSLELPDVSSTKSATATGSGGAKQTSSMSIYDLLSLYNQTAQSAAGTEIQKSSETDLHISKRIPEAESSDGVDDFDDSWHFKGASPEQKDANVSFAKQISENGVDSKWTFPEPLKVNGDDDLHDSWEFKDASFENGDESEGCKPVDDMPTLPEPTILNDVDDDVWDLKGTNQEKGHGIESTSPELSIVKDADIFNDNSWDIMGARLENGDKIQSSKQVGDDGVVFDSTVPESGIASSSNVFDEDSWNFKGVDTGNGDNKEFALSLESRSMEIDVFNDDSWNFTGASPQKQDRNPAGEVGNKGLGLIQTLAGSGPTNIKGVFDDDSWNFKGPDPEKGDGLPVGEVDVKELGLIPSLKGSGPTKNNGVFDDDSWIFKDPVPEKDGNPAAEAGEKGLGLNQTSPDSGRGNSDGFFDDDSWSFKGASPEKGDGLDLNGSWGFKEAMTTTNSGDLHMKPSNMEVHQTLYTHNDLDDLIEFYGKLKDEVCIIAASRLNKVKESYGGHEDAKLEAHDEEIQEILNEINNPKSNLKDTHSTRTSDVHGLLKIVQEKFQVFEDEYQLSCRLKLVEDEPLLLLELLRHVTFTLKILRSGSVKEYSTYVSTWKKLISVCQQELEHGATLWKQALAKNVQSKLLSTSEGTKYFLSLGEIYRAVGVLQASTKLYKPWILLNPTDFSAISASLHECSNLWLNSGLQQALCSISDPVEFQVEGTVKALLDSIRQIHGLDINIPQNHKETICQLSLLTATTIPDMKMVEWEGKNYFVKIANLWVNLVSLNPPDLPGL